MVRFKVGLPLCPETSAIPRYAAGDAAGSRAEFSQVHCRKREKKPQKFWSIKRRKSKSEGERGENEKFLGWLDAGCLLD